MPSISPQPIRSMAPWFARPMDPSAARASGKRTVYQTLASTNLTQAGGVALTGLSITKFISNIIRQEEGRWSSFFTTAVGSFLGLGMIAIGSNQAKNNLAYDLFGTAVSDINTKLNSLQGNSPLTAEQILSLKTSFMEFSAQVKSALQAERDSFVDSTQAFFDSSSYGPDGDIYLGDRSSVLDDNSEAIAFNTLNNLFFGRDSRGNLQFSQHLEAFKKSINNVLGLADSEINIFLDSKEKVVSIVINTSKVYQDGHKDDKFYQPFLRIPVSCNRFCEAITERIPLELANLNIDGHLEKFGDIRSEESLESLQELNQETLRSLQSLINFFSSGRVTRPKKSGWQGYMEVLSQIGNTLTDGALKNNSPEAGIITIDSTTGKQALPQIATNNIIRLIPSHLQEWFANLIGIGFSSVTLGSSGKVESKGEVSDVSEVRDLKSANEDQVRSYFSSLGLDSTHADGINRPLRFALIKSLIDGDYKAAITNLDTIEGKKDRNAIHAQAIDKRDNALLALKRIDERAFNEMYQIEFKAEPENPQAIHEVGLYSPTLHTDLLEKLIADGRTHDLYRAFRNETNIVSKLPDGGREIESADVTRARILASLDKFCRSDKLRDLVNKFYVADHKYRASLVANELNSTLITSLPDATKDEEWQNPSGANLEARRASYESMFGFNARSVRKLSEACEWTTGLVISSCEMASNYFGFNVEAALKSRNKEQKALAQSALRVYLNKFSTQPRAFERMLAGLNIEPQEAIKQNADRIAHSVINTVLTEDAQEMLAFIKAKTSGDSTFKVYTRQNPLYGRTKSKLERLLQITPKLSEVNANNLKAEDLEKVRTYLLSREEHTLPNAQSLIELLGLKLSTHLEESLSPESRERLQKLLLLIHPSQANQITNAVYTYVREQRKSTAGGLRAITPSGVATGATKA